MDQTVALSILRVRSSLYMPLFLAGLCHIFIAVFASDCLRCPNAVVGLVMLSAIALPAGIAGSVVLAWVFYAARQYTLAVWVTAVPLINIALVILAWALLSRY